MKPAFFIVCLSLAAAFSSVYAAASPAVCDHKTVVGRCATRDVGEEEAGRIQAVIAPLLPDRENHESTFKRGMIQDFSHEGVTIPVAFHVIHKGSEGLISQADIDSQIQVMNDAYLNTGFQFELYQADFTDSVEWFTMERGDIEREAKSALSLDPHYYLNLYTAGLEDGLLGYAKLRRSYLSYIVKPPYQ